jgi:hypothetical protein
MDVNVGSDRSPRSARVLLLSSPFAIEFVQVGNRFAGSLGVNVQLGAVAEQYRVERQNSAELRDLCLIRGFRNLVRLSDARRRERIQLSHGPGQHEKIFGVE